jgi:hypothetical protein
MQPSYVRRKTFSGGKVGTTCFAEMNRHYHFCNSYLFSVLQRLPMGVF